MRQIKKRLNLTSLTVLNSGYSSHGANTTKTTTRGYLTDSKDARHDVDYNFKTLRARSVDLQQGVPIAAGALKQLRQWILELDPSVRQVEGWVTIWKQDGRLPDAAPASAVAPAERRSAAAPEEAQLAMQEALSQALGLPVRISGSLRKGRVSIAFGSPEDLAALAGRLGLE